MSSFADFKFGSLAEFSSENTQSLCLHIKVSPLVAWYEHVAIGGAHNKPFYLTPSASLTPHPPRPTCRLRPTRLPAQVPAPTTVAAGWSWTPSAAPWQFHRPLRKWRSPMSTSLRWSWALMTSGSRRRSWHTKAAVKTLLLVYSWLLYFHQH